MKKRFRLIGIFCILILTAKAQQQKIDSLLSRLDEKPTDSLLAKTYLAISDEFSAHDPRNALYYNDSAFMVLAGLRLLHLETACYYQRSIIQMNLGELEEAEQSVLKAIYLSEQTNDTQQQGTNYNRLGAIYENMGQLDKTLKSYLKALELFKSINEIRGIGACLNRIGNFHNRREEYHEAVKYYNEALTIFEQLNNKMQLASVYNNLGVAYFNLTRFNDALEYYNRSKQLLVTIKEEREVATRDLNIGKVYKQLHQPAKAIEYLNKAYASAVHYENKNIISQVHLQKGLVYIDLKDYTNAINQFDDGVMVARSMKSPGLEIQFYKNMSDAYIQIDQYKEGYYYQQRHNTLKDSLFTIEKNKEMSLMEARFESAQNEQTIALLRDDAKNKSLLLLTSLGVAGLLVLSLILLLLNFRNRQRTMHLINQQHDELNRRHIADLLKEQELNAIRKMLEGQEQERMRVSKELHDGIGGTLAGIKMNVLKYLSTHKEEVIHNTLERIDEACREVRHISHNLAPPEFFNSALTDITRNYVANALMEKQLNVTYEFFSEEEINKLPHSLQIELYRIIQELVMNIVKHANCKQVGIFITHHENYINLMIEDDGIGFDPKAQKQGIGLRSIQNRIRGLKGQLTIDSKIGQGTIINADIPIV